MLLITNLPQPRQLPKRDDEAGGFGSISPQDLIVVIVFFFSQNLYVNMTIKIVGYLLLKNVEILFS